MEIFPWKDEYSVHIEKIDLQHRKLLSLVNELHRGLTGGQSRKDLQRIFAGLLDYALFHFETEEELMSAYHFPGLEEHRKEHDEFRQKLADFLDAFLDLETDVAADMVLFLVEWLKKHVFVTDKKYGAYLNERNVH